MAAVPPIVRHFASPAVPTIRAIALIANQEPVIPIDTFDVELAAYGSVGHFSCRTAISALAEFGWGPTNLLGTEIANSQPALVDGSPTYPIKLYATSAYNPVPTPPLIFGGDIDELKWDFDHDELTISGRDYGGRMKDWEASLSAAYVNQSFTAVASQIITGVHLKPKIATSSSIQTSLKQLLYALGTANDPGTVSMGYTSGGNLNSVSQWTAPQNMWELLNNVARSVGYIVTVHNDGTVYVGPPGGDSEISLTPRTFTWFAASATPSIVPVRNLEVTHGPRQYGNFTVKGFAFHAPSVQTSSSSVFFTSASKASFTTTAIGKQSITAGVYKGHAGAGGLAPGKPAYYFYHQGLTEPQLQAETLAKAFEIAKYLYVIRGQIDGDPTLIPTTPLTLADATGASLQGYASQALTISAVNHRFDMRNGFVTDFTAWYAPSAQQLPPEAGETVEVTA